jgi:hypothetical protein
MTIYRQYGDISSFREEWTRSCLTAYRTGRVMPSRFIVE